MTYNHEDILRLKVSMTYSNADIIRLIDLTSLNDGDTAAQISALCQQAHTASGPVAAVCVYPQFAAQAAAEANGIPVASVVNFPHGTDTLEKILADTDALLADGAAEIDLVLPYRNLDSALETVTAVKQRCSSKNAQLKVIIESGYFSSQDDVAKAAGIAIDGGADFVKTSTGKIAVGATPQAAETICRTIAEKDAAQRTGIKISGGVRTPEDARLYLGIIEKHFGRDWITPQRVRIGASSLLSALL